MKRSYSIILLVLMAVVFSSCEEKIDFDLNNSEYSRLVVEGSITDQQKAHTVKLTRTTSYYNNEQAPAERNAIVTISDDNEAFILTETSHGIYQTDSTVQGVIGNTYTLNILTMDNKSYIATSALSSIAPIDSITYEYIEQFVHGGDQVKGYLLKTSGPEPLGVGNNYMWFVYIDNKLVTEKVSDIMFVTDDYVDGNYISEFGFYLIEQELRPTDTLDVTVEAHSFPRSYYDFLMAIMLETEYRGQGGGMFDGPPANVPSNISNGAIGYFRASAVVSKSIKVSG